MQVSLTPIFRFMYRIVLLTIALVFFLSFSSFSQTVLSTGNSGTGSNIDVYHHTCYWRINPDSTIKYIKGYVLTNFTTIQNNVSSISFDMNNVLNVDSIIYHRQRLVSGAYTQNNNIITIQLPQALNNAVKDSIIIYYEGTPPSPSGAASGYTLATDQTSKLKYISTLSESYEDRNWWPCKADMQDKIDSMDMYISVPWTGTDTFWVAANGVIKDSAISGNNRVFHYKISNPIASYLVGLSVARYNRYYRTPITIGSVKVPVVYYLMAGKPSGSYSTVVSAMDQATQLVSIYSKKYGDYPFKNEKHGYYEGLNGAEGMEHQTFSAIASNGISSITTLAHELMHQWFGDKVSFATWNDLWLAEGFAVYGEILGAELLPSFGQTVVAKRTNVKQSAQSITDVGAWIPNSSIGNSDLIWNSSYGTAVYDRGGMVVSMLRTMCGDSLYFKIMKQYIASPTLAYKSATTDTLIQYFNKTLGVDITPFFTDYVYGNGWPTYFINYTTLPGNKMALNIVSQSTSTGAATSWFRGPVVVRVQGSTAAQDTLLVLFDWGNGNLSYAGNGISAPVSGNQLIYNLPFTPITITFDPYAQTLADGYMILDLKILDFSIQKHQNKSLLKLILDDNKNNLPIYLERSIDGDNFNQIGLMNRDNISGTTSYTFTDSIPVNGMNYYRVYFMDVNGKKQYSKILTADFKSDKFVSVFPNPATKEIMVSTSYSNSLLSITDLSGKVYITKRLNSTVTKLNIDDLSPGIYMVILQTAEGNKTTKLVVE